MVLFPLHFLWCSLLLSLDFGHVLQEDKVLYSGLSSDQYGDTRSYELKEDVSRISIITKRDAMHSFCFSSRDEENIDIFSKFVANKDLKSAKIDIVIGNEKLRGISGTYDLHEDKKIITSLSFTTNTNKFYGPFGTKRGSDFSLVVKDHSLTRFRAHCGWLLDDIGVSLGNLPFTMTESVKPWGGLGGDNYYNYIGKGEIWQIYLEYEGAIRSIKFTSQDERHQISFSRRIGGAGWYKGAEIVLDTNKNEKLVGMSGTAGKYLGFWVITSLKFYTSKNRTFGPFGGGAGTPFSYMAEEGGSITGFYGRYGDLLDSIGVHVQVTQNLVKQHA